MDDDLLALIREFEPLCEAELTRIGISEEDQRWIHAGIGGSAPSRDQYQAWLDRLRALPTDMGPEAYCAWLGFDYQQRKRMLMSRGAI